MRCLREQILGRGGGEGDDEVSERTNIGFFKHGM